VRQGPSCPASASCPHTRSARHHRVAHTEEQLAPPGLTCAPPRLPSLVQVAAIKRDASCPRRGWCRRHAALTHLCLGNLLVPLGHSAQAGGERRPHICRVEAVAPKPCELWRRSKGDHAPRAAR
jgi:hypothetical protein